jgi:hypothetical protein
MGIGRTPLRSDGALGGMADHCSASMAEGRPIVILLWVGRLGLMIKEGINS